MTQQQRRQPQQDLVATSTPPVARAAFFDQERSSQVRILAGAQVQDMALGGQTVAEARSLAGTVFAVDPSAQAFVDGRRVSDEHVLANGQELEFVKRTGEKGAHRPLERDPDPGPDPDRDMDIAEVLAALRAGRTLQLPLRPRARARRVPAPEERRVGDDPTVGRAERAGDASQPDRRVRPIRGLSLEVTGDELVWKRGARGGGRAKVHDLAASLADVGSTRDRWLVSPRGVRLMVERDEGDVVGVVIEMEPGPRQVGWISETSERPCGAGTRYAVRRLSFPWVVLVVVFESGELTDLQQAFYRTQPLGSAGDPLYYSNLLNCMPSTHGLEAKLCLRKMPGRLADLTWEERINSVTEHFWEASFNRSADIDEHKSFYWSGGEVDARLADVTAWERATTAEPYFALGLPWRQAPFSIGETLERMLDEVAPRPQIERVEDLVTALQRRQRGA